MEEIQRMLTILKSLSCFHMRGQVLSRSFSAASAYYSGGGTTNKQEHVMFSDRPGDCPADEHWRTAPLHLLPCGHSPCDTLIRQRTFLSEDTTTLVVSTYPLSPFFLGYFFKWDRKLCSAYTRPYLCVTPLESKWQAALPRLGFTPIVYSVEGDHTNLIWIYVLDILKWCANFGLDRNLVYFTVAQRKVFMRGLHRHGVTAHMLTHLYAYRGMAEDFGATDHVIYQNLGGLNTLELPEIGIKLVVWKEQWLHDLFVAFEHCAWEAYDEAINGGGDVYVSVDEKVRILADRWALSSAATEEGEEPFKHAWFHFTIPTHIREEGWQIEATLSERRAFQAAIKVI